MTPYKTDKVTIGKNYYEPFKPVQFSPDEEFIQDLLLGNKVQMHDTFDMLVVYFLAIVGFGLLFWGLR